MTPKCFKMTLKCTSTFSTPPPVNTGVILGLPSISGILGIPGVPDLPGILVGLPRISGIPAIPGMRAVHGIYLMSH